MKSERASNRFPLPCLKCGKTEVSPATVSNYPCRIKHDGRLYDVVVPELRVPQCAACGELYFDNDADAQTRYALREQLGLLQPEELRRLRKAFGLKQSGLAEALGVAPETISRWENDRLIQSLAMDKFLRTYFEFSEVRSHLGTAIAQTNLAVLMEAVNMELPFLEDEELAWTWGPSTSWRQCFKEQGIETDAEDTLLVG